MKVAEKAKVEVESDAKKTVASTKGPDKKAEAEKATKKTDTVVNLSQNLFIYFSEKSTFKKLETVAIKTL